MLNEQDLARAVAADLGPDVSAAVAAPPTDDRTRAFAITEAAAIGGFLVHCAGVTIQLWRGKQDRALLVAALANSRELLAAYPRLDPEKRMGLMARIVKRMLPDFVTGAARPGTATAQFADKRAWVDAYLADRRTAAGMAHDAGGEYRTRDFVGGATILVPFADQEWWIVYQPIGWVPSAADGAGVVRVDVPKGFVTDLATIPGYLWAVLQKTGRYGNAAIYHDWLYWQQACTREVADRVFDRAMHDMGVDDLTRNVMWAGVRVFGGSAWEDNTAAKARGEKFVLQRFPDKPAITWENWRRQPGVFV